MLLDKVFYVKYHLGTMGGGKKSDPVENQVTGDKEYAGANPRNNDEDISDNVCDFGNFPISDIDELDKRSITNLDQMLFTTNSEELDAQINNEIIDYKFPDFPEQWFFKVDNFLSSPTMPEKIFEDSSEDEILENNKQVFVPQNEVNFTELPYTECKPDSAQFQCICKPVSAVQMCTIIPSPSNRICTKTPIVEKEISISNEISEYFHQFKPFSPMFRDSSNCYPDYRFGHFLSSDELNEPTGMLPYRCEKEYEDDFSSEFMKLVNVSEMCPWDSLGNGPVVEDIYSNERGSIKSSVYHDHSYAASEGIVFIEEHSQSSKSVESDSETVNTYDAKENSLGTPAKITIRINSPVTLPEEPVKRRGRPKRKISEIQQPTDPLPPAKRSKRSTSSVANKATKISTKQKSKARSRNNSKQMSNDKREQHNKAERDRRKNLKMHLNFLESLIPLHTLQCVQNAITYVKKILSEERENNLYDQVMNRLESVYDSQVNEESFIKRKKGAHFSKVVVLQSAMFYYQKRLGLAHSDAVDTYNVLANMTNSGNRLDSIKKIDKKLLKVRNLLLKKCK